MNTKNGSDPYMKSISYEKYFIRNYFPMKTIKVVILTFM